MDSTVELALVSRVWVNQPEGESMRVYGSAVKWLVLAQR